MRSAGVDSTHRASRTDHTSDGSGPDCCAKISQDAFQGSAQYTVSVDGVQIGGTLTAGASHASGKDDTITVLGTFAAGNHTLTVNFLNDLYNGTATTDRNLYVDGITFDTVPVANGTAALLSAGPLNFTFSSTATTPPTGRHTPAGRRHAHAHTDTRSRRPRHINRSGFVSDSRPIRRSGRSPAGTIYQHHP